MRGEVLRHRRSLGLFLLLMLLGGCQKATNDRDSKTSAVTFIGWGPATLRELSADQNVIDRFTRETGIRVDFIAGPESMTDRLDLYRRYFARKSATPDVYYMDIVWPAVIADDVADLTPLFGAEAKQLLQPLVLADTIDGKLTSIPFNTEIGLLYFRADLLTKYGYRHPPATWDELEKMSERIQAGERAAGRRDFWGYVWQGAAYEGLTCNALEWQASYGGGRIIEPSKVISVNNPQTIQALKKVKSWIGKISPSSVVAFKEQDSRNVWNAGNAAFARDWIWRQYKGELLEPSLKDKIGIALLPAGPAGRAGTLGGQSLAISKYSAHPQEAAALVKFLTSHDTQMNLWSMHAMLSTRRDFYEDPRNLQQRPQIEQLWKDLENAAVSRPSAAAGKKYDDVSRAYFTSVHSVLAGEVEADKAMAELELKLEQITGMKPGPVEAVGAGH